MVYVSNMGMLYCLSVRQWKQILAQSAAVGGNAPATILDGMPTIQPLGHVTNITDWSTAEAAEALANLKGPRKQR